MVKGAKGRFAASHRIEAPDSPLRPAPAAVHSTPMPKPFDAALKHLIDAFAGDWLAWLRPRLGVPADAAFDALDADLGTVSPQADKLFRFRDPALGLAHLELQAGPDPSLPGRLLVYNVLAEYRHAGPVHS